MDKVRPFLNNYYSKNEIDNKFNKIDSEIKDKTNKANDILALKIPTVPNWNESVIPSWREIPNYPKRECPMGAKFTALDFQRSTRYHAWSDGDLNYTMLADGEVYFTNSSRALKSLTINGKESGWNVVACGEVRCFSTSPKYRAKKGDEIHLHYWDGDWTIYVKYDVDVCVQTQDYVLNDSIGQTPIRRAYEIPDLRVCDTGEFNNTYRFVRIPTGISCCILYRYGKSRELC
mgnify:CR=1 FL=1